jgi:hypothetical protein
MMKRSRKEVCLFAVAIFVSLSASLWFVLRMRKSGER